MADRATADRVTTGGQFATRAAGLGLLVLLVILIARCDRVPLRADLPAPGSPDRAAIEVLLAAAERVPERVRAPGYQRGCGAGEGCVFGPAWSDDTDAEAGRNGCDTRNDVLARTLDQVEYRPGARDCVVVAGVLADPYSGQLLEFTKQDAGAVQIDHVIPLAAAWDLGAHDWPLELRQRFANDVAINLLAVNGPDNQRKSDGTPAEWLPANPAYRCFYAGKYLSAAVAYRLPITDADETVLRSVAARC
ncbi:HNH endonuclease family protein [Tomitella biformata]|uniref:HNH endonuclease family protein n=1 Tax=Tomitella biformata TaxID=630403 RepID=UPI0004BBCF27|nr:HNH endonuclease family protein [Tomitella biformata]